MTLTGIGVYGHTLESFLQELRNKKIATLVDVRAFRGLRGKQYRWANSRALQDALRASSIKYLHLKELAPPRELRIIQHADDASAGIRKSQRALLADTFRNRYRQYAQEVLTQELAAMIPNHAALLCVESSDAACHRSVLIDLMRTR
jgi:uncharacterized protein (DUF488 family)